MEKAQFSVNLERCIGCGMCLNVCPGNMVGGDVLRMEDGHPVMIDQYKFGWNGCWRCMHCLAICPEAAISILGEDPDDLPAPPSPAIKDDLTRLLQFRRTCRDFQKEEVDPATIDAILTAVQAVPTGGNNQRLDFSVVYTRAAMKRLWQATFQSGKQMSLFEKQEVPEDLSALRLYDAPCLFIAHKQVGEKFRDGDLVEINMATAYFELLANAYGLGTVVSTYAAEQLSEKPEALDLLGIPEDHKFMTIVGFGYPQYEYQRGIKKTRPTIKIK